jgi:hypothetical protein
MQVTRDGTGSSSDVGSASDAGDADSIVPWRNCCQPIASGTRTRYDDGVSVYFLA